MASQLVRARVAVYLDDRLAPRRGLATDQPPTVVRDPGLRRQVDAVLASARYRRAVGPYLLPTCPARAPGFMGLGTRLVPVPARLSEWRSEWRGGVMWWTLEWEVGPMPPDSALDLQACAARLAGGASDGWGEVAEQGERFGALCAYQDDTDTFGLAGPRERTGLTAAEDGRYALLITLRRAQVTLGSASRRQQPVTTRPSPSASATGFPGGTRKRGNDGRVWVVAVTRAGVHRWVPAG